MTPELPDIDVLFVAGFGPITRSTADGEAFYVTALGLPLKPMPGNESYWLTEPDALGGVKHFALWPLEQAAVSCFGEPRWPETIPVPQAWIEFEVRDIAQATARLKANGYRLLVDNREEPWGQTVTRLLSPEGLLAGVTVTPWLREKTA
jgi:catechol 2,3-dioxygenase-like lactoylglutathione lyase family enzyme